MLSVRAAKTATLSRAGTLRALLLGGSAFCGLVSSSAVMAANILPTQGTRNLATPTTGAGSSLNSNTLVGGVVTPGTVNYTSTGAAATVTLTASRTLIDWTTFEVGSGNTLNFTFTGTTNDIVLNRVATGAINIDAGGTVNGTFGGATGGNIWFLAPNGVFINGTVSAGGVLATNNVSLADLNLLSDNISSLKGELAAGGSLLDFEGVVSATGASIDGSGNIVLSGDVSMGAGGSATLISTGTINQTGGVLDATDLSGSSVGGAALTDRNAISDLTGFTNTGAGGFSLGDVSSLNVTGPVSLAAGNSLALTTYFSVCTFLCPAPDLTISSPITLTGGSLSLTAVGPLIIDAPINVNGATAVTIDYVAAKPTGLSFGPGDSLTYNTATGAVATASQGGSLTINGQAYTLLYQLAQAGSTGPDTGAEDVAGIDNNAAAGGDAGFYAVAVNLAGSTGAPQFTSALVGAGANVFSGTFEGLGHSISNLTISDPVSTDNVGLIGSNSGLVRDIAITSGLIEGVGRANVGGLVGLNEFIPANGDVGAVFASSSAASVVGGAGDVGGLVGNNNGGVILQSSASGAVTGGADVFVGGLAGATVSSETDAGVVVGGITQSYATGAVTGGASAYAGGLAGYNDGPITQSYAMGAVTAGASSNVGGLVGFDAGSGISEVFATGSVTGGAGANLGGLVGQNVAGTIASAAFDTLTTGQSAGIGLDGNAQQGNIETLTTGELQYDGLPTGFSSVWGGGSGGLYPYLNSFFPNGVQAVGDFALSTFANGAPLASGTSGPVEIGLVAGGGAAQYATTGANGYFYFTLPAGSLTAGESLLTYTASGAAPAAHVTTATGAMSEEDNILYANVVFVPTAATLLSAAPTQAQAITIADGVAGANADALASIGATTGLALNATGASFTIDQALNVTTDFAVQTASGAPLTVSAPVTVNGGGTLALLSNGALAINAPVSVLGAGGVDLAYDTSSPTNLSFGAPGTVTYETAAGGVATTSQGGTLAINGQAYTLLYQLAEAGSTGPDTGTNDIAGIDNNTAAGGDFGYYALATNVAGTGTTAAPQFTSALVLGGEGFAGVFEGLGHTIRNLTINDPNAEDEVGLFAANLGVIRDIGIVGGSITGASDGDVGSLTGFNFFGTIVGASSSASVTGGANADVGGLVGYNSGGVIQSYATGAVTGGANSYAGGLVGYNQGGGEGEFFGVTESFSTGAVTAGAGSDVGGLVGYNDGAILQSYATGAVTLGVGGGFSGGLVGYNDYGGTITAGVYDLDTTGQAQGVGIDVTGSATATGFTTSQLQTGGLPAGFDPTVWGGGTGGLYPYLTSLFPAGVQAVSGFVYSDAGITSVASGLNGPATVGLLAGGASVGAATTGANGYYYVFAPSGSLAAGSSLLAYTIAGAPGEATLATSLASGAQPLVNLYGSAVTVPTAATTLSAAPTFAEAQTLALAAAGGNATAVSDITGAGVTGLGLTPTGASFTVDQAVTTGATFVIQTAAGAGLTVAAPITVSSGGGLGLISGGTLSINAPVIAEGAVGVNLTDINTAPDSLNFAPGASVSFVNADGTVATTGAGGYLSINGQAYTLLYQLAEAGSTGPDTGTNDVAGIDNNAAAGFDNGFYALANNVAGTGTAAAPQFTTSPVVGGEGFAGVFEGLGHKITNLTINDTVDFNVGLFADSVGTIRDLGLVGGSVVGGSGGDYGALIGTNGGTVFSAYSTASVSGGGTNAYIGGLVGENDGVISQSYATGSVTGGVSADAGGLAGYNDGQIIRSFATGAVNAGATSDVGGLVGYNTPAPIEQGFFFLSFVSQSYSTGAVTGGQGSYVGGLVGYNDTSINQSYATGAVSVVPGTTQTAYAGGLVGYNDVAGKITSGVYDSLTTGQTVGIGFDGSAGQLTTGLTTTQLQTGGLPTGFNAAVWSGGTGGLYPYLSVFFPGGVQAVSGFAYSDAGITPLASGVNGAQTVSLDGGGSLSGASTTGANGYYYVFGAAGSLTSGESLLAYVSPPPAGGPGAATLSASTGALAQTGVNLYGGAVTTPTAATTLSTAPTLAQAQTLALAAATDDTAAQNAIDSATGRGLLTTGASFTVNQAVNTGATLYIQTGAGDPLRVTQAITITGGGSLGLVSGGALTIDAAISAHGAVGVNLAYNTALPTNLTFAAGDALTYETAAGAAATASQGGYLSINGQAYRLLYTLANAGSTGPDTGTSDIAGIDANSAAGGDAGFYALAGNLNAAGTTYAKALAGSGANVFSGAFEGLGHAITGLTIQDTTSGTAGAYQAAGLFGTSSGTLRDVSVTGANVKGSNYTDVGALVGANQGGVYQDIASGTLNGGTDAGVGSLVGLNEATGVLTADHASATVTGVGGALSAEGDLVGENAGSISQSYATGLVSGAGGSTGGLVGFNSGGTITNSYATGSVSGSASGAVGGLVGESSGALSSDYATGLVVDTAANATVGGLVGDNAAGSSITKSYALGSAAGGSTSAIGGLAGYNDGAITLSYANGPVGAVLQANTAVGGLVGYNDTAGTIANTYATGPVNDGVSTTGAAGGLVGHNYGSVSLSYATGAVTGGINDGGLVGNNATTGTITSSAIDTLTTGLTAGIGKDNNPVAQAGNIAALTTTQLQGALPTGFSAAIWGTGASLYPYLTTFYPTGVQALSGFAYDDVGFTPAASGLNGAVPLGLTLNGVAERGVYGGANGYFYFIVPNGTIPAGGSLLLAYSTYNATTGAQDGALLTPVTGTTTGLNIYGNYLLYPTAAATFSTSGFLATLAQVEGYATTPTSIPNLSPYIQSSASSFTLDTPWTLSTGLEIQTIFGGSPIIIAQPLTLSTNGSVVLQSGGDIDLNAPVNTGQGFVGLYSGGAITQTSSAIITANTVSGYSFGPVTLNANNSFDFLSGFNNYGTGDVTITDANADGNGLTINGDVNAGSGNNLYLNNNPGGDLTGPLTLAANLSAGLTVNLYSSVGITQASGVITTGTLTIKAGDDVNLNDANLFGVLGVSFSGGSLAVTDAQSMTVDGGGEGIGAINNVTLTTVNGGSITLNDQVYGGGTVGLFSAGTITETGTGSISASTFTGSSVGGATLNNTNNQFDTLAGFTNTGVGDVTISVENNDGNGLTVTAPVDAGAGNNLYLNNYANPDSDFSPGPLTLAANVSAAGGSVNLDSDGDIVQTAGIITTGTVTANAGGMISLTGANQFATLGYTFANNDVSVTDAQNLTVDAGGAGITGADITLTTLGGASLTLNDALYAYGGTVSLLASGPIQETASGGVFAQTLTGTSVGGASLANGVNSFDNLAGFTNTGVGDVSIADANTDGNGLTVTADINAGAGNNLTLTNSQNPITDGGTTGPLTLEANLIAAGGSVNLFSAAAITQTSGAITTGTLTGSSVGGTSLTDANLFDTLGSFIDSGANVSITDAQPTGMTVTGPVDPSAGGVINLTTTAPGAPLTLAGDVTAAGGTVNLSSQGIIDQTGGIITTATLNSSSQGAQTLTDQNQVVTLGTFTNNGAGGTLAFTDAIASGLTLTTDINAGAGDIDITTTAPGATLAVASFLTTDATNTVNLNSAGPINQTGGAITTGTLAGSSVGGASLTGGDNSFANLGPFTETATGASVSIDDNASTGMTVSGAVDGGPGGVLTLTTTQGPIALAANVSAAGGSVNLDSDGDIVQTAGIITTGTVTANAGGMISLTGANQFATLGYTFANNDVSVTDAQNLTVDAGGAGITGADITLTTLGGGSLTLNDALYAYGGTVSLLASGPIQETANGGVFAQTLTGTSVGGASLANGVNSFDYLAGFTNTGVGDVSIADANTDGNGLTVTADVNAGAGNNLTLTNSQNPITDGGTTGPLTLEANLIAAGGSVNLVSAAAITQTSGAITTGTLTGSSVGGATLNGANNSFDNLGPFTNSGVGDVNIADANADGNGLTVVGDVDAGAGNNLFLTNNAPAESDFGAGPLTLSANLSAAGGTVNLSSAASIQQTAGVITTGTLTVQAYSDAILTDANQFATLGYSTSGGSLAVTDAQNLTVDAGGDGISADNNVTLTTLNGGSMTINDYIYAGGTVGLFSAGTITETANGGIQASALTGSSVGGASLAQAQNNGFDTLAGFTNTGVGDVTISVENNDGNGLTVTAPVDAGAGNNLYLNNYANPDSDFSPGPLTLAANVSAAGGSVNLDSDGDIVQTAGIITTGTVTANAGGMISLTGANQFATLGYTFANNDVSVTDAQNLTVDAGGAGITGADITLTTLGGGSLTLNDALYAYGGTVSLLASGPIQETANGGVFAQTLTGTSVGGASLANGVNSFDYLAGFTNTGVGDVSIADANTDGNGLTVTADVNAGAGNNLTLTNSQNPITDGGTTGPLTLEANLIAAGGSVNLVSAAAITQTSGAITTGTLTGSSVGGATLNGANNSFDNLGPFTNTGVGDVSIFDNNTDGNGLTVVGTVDAGAANNLYIATGEGVPLVLAADLDAGVSVNLNSGSTISQVAGVINTGTLSVQSDGDAILNDANQFGTLGYSTATGNLAVTDAQNLTVDAGGEGIYGANITLTTLGGSSLTLNDSLYAYGGTVSLLASGPILQSETTGIYASTLTGTSVGGAFIASANNQFDFLAGFTNTGVGDVTIEVQNADGNGLTVTAPVDAGAGNNLTLNNYAFSDSGFTPGPLTLAANVSAAGGSVNLDSDGDIVQTAGVITTGTVTAQAGGMISLTGANQFATLGFTQANDDVSVTDAQNLTVDAGGEGIYGANITLTTLGGASLTINDSINTYEDGTVSLLASGPITETANGGVFAQTLTGTSVGGASLVNGTNNFDYLAGFTNTGVGDVSIADANTDGGGLTVTADVDAGAGNNLTLINNLNPNSDVGTTGALTLAADVTAAGGSVNLISAGTVNQASGIITTGTVTAASVGGTTLGGANLFDNLGGVQNQAPGDIVINDAKASGMTVTGDVDPDIYNSGMTGSVYLTTAGPLTLAANVEADVLLSMISGGAITQTAGRIDALNITGSSVGGAALNQPGNIFEYVQGFTNVGAGGISLTDGGIPGAGIPIDVTGDVDAGAGNALTLTNTGGGIILAANVSAAGGSVNLFADGSIVQTAGIITTGTVTGSSVGGTQLTDANLFSNLGPFSNSDASDVVISDSLASGLTVSAPVDAGAGNNLTLITTAGPMTLAADISAVGGTVTLTSAETLTQTGGIITTGTFTGSSLGGASLTDANAIGTLASFTNYDSGSISLTNAQSLTVTGTVDNTQVQETAGSGRDISLTLTSGDLTGEGVFNAERDVAIQAQGGSLTFASATAGDDLVLRAADSITVYNSLTSTGAVTAAENADTTGAGDVLAAASPMTVFGHVYSDLTDGSHIDVVAAGGDLSVGQATAPGDVRLQSLGGSVYTGAVTAGRDIVIDAAQSVDADDGANVMTAGQDVAIDAEGGYISAQSITAGSNVVLRADTPGQGGVTVFGDIVSGAGAGQSGAGAYLAAYAPMAVFGAADPALTGGDVDIQGDRVDVTGSITANFGASDIRIVATGLDIADCECQPQALYVGGGLTASRDVALDATGGGSSDGGATTGSVLVQGVINATRDVAIRSLTGSITIPSATAQDDIVLVAPQGGVNLNGSLTAIADDGAAQGIGLTLFEAVSESLDGLFTLPSQGIFIDAQTYANAGYGGETGATLAAGSAIGIALADPNGLSLADANPGTGSWVQTTALFAPNVSLFESVGNLNVGTATVQSQVGEGDSALPGVTGLNLYATNLVQVNGVFAPSIDNTIDLGIGSPTVAAWTPSQIDVVNNPGSTADQGSIGFQTVNAAGVYSTNPRTFYAAALYANADILLGTSDFIAANSAISNPTLQNQIDPNIPNPLTAVNTSRSVLLAAGDISLSAGSMIVQQDTNGFNTTNGVGSYITRTLTLNGYGGYPPPTIDLFGVFVAPPVTEGAGASPSTGPYAAVDGLFSGIAAANTTQITLGPLLVSSPYREQYRINSCVIFGGSDCTTVTYLPIVLDPFTQGDPPSEDGYPADNGYPQDAGDPLSSVSPPNVRGQTFTFYLAPFPGMWEDGFLNFEARDIEDPTITGAPNEEIWRRPEERP